ncbi:large conductance mechanosensitive channel protein MscL [Auraticoccus sp. F435]|uniref:Large conductance mechanosensitive channel protein MscL n=1 Tax=Auraticoccus cholistanensis TaxID=2656650 RepID=A0A6A9UUV7_9ACTN|nr:large conductance mechanosensitive channel protein MscL [Auraticoccus cholistanensis]
MKGFKAFLLRGNLIELAVAFILGTAFATVVSTFTAILTDLLGLIAGQPDFSGTAVAGINVGAFINAVLNFFIVAAALYFVVVLPYNKIKARTSKPVEQEEAQFTTSEQLLVEIRDLLRGR